MRYLLDTNVLSETRKIGMNPKVRAFLSDAKADSLYVSVLGLGELRKGVAVKRQSDPAAADALLSWVDGLEEGFANRIVPVTAEIARLWGEMSADRSRPVVDTLIAATVIALDMTLVTRNIIDFNGLTLPLINPWE